MIRKTLAGLALIAALGCESPVYNRPEGGKAIKAPKICEKTTYLGSDLSRSRREAAWELNCFDKENKFHYFRWDTARGRWYETVVVHD